MQDGVGSATAALPYSFADAVRRMLRPTNGPGYEFTFRERGRDFYAFIDSSNRAVATEAVAILNTLRVSPR
jgi:hypothetical protein